MAEEESRNRSKRPDRRDPARNVRRDPPTIDGQAQDITPGLDATSESLVPPEAPVEQATGFPANDGAPSPAATSDVPHEQRSTLPDGRPQGLGDEASPAETSPAAASGEPGATRRDARTPWGTLAAVGFVVLAAGLLYLFTQLSSLPPDNSAAVADLKGRLAAIESRPAADPSGPNDRLTKLEGSVADLRGNLDALDKRVASLADTASAQPNVAGQVADLQTIVANLKTGLAAVTSSVASLPRPDLGPIQARLGDVDGKLSGLQATVSSIPHIDLGPLTSKVDAMEGRLKPIEAETDAARSPEQVAQRRAAPVAVTAQAIASAIDAGQPFPRELQALQALGIDTSKLAPLQAVVVNGAPSLRDLQTALAEMRDRIVAQGATPASGSYVDRLVAGASNLVQVRPLGSVVGDTPSAIVARMDDEIGRDDLAAAIAEWHRLPDSSQSSSKALADRIKLRLDAERAAREIGANAIGAMALPHG